MKPLTLILSPEGRGRVRGYKKILRMEMNKILIVDDEEVVRQVLHRVLTKQGYEVETAQDGVKALKKIQEDHFVMVISDLKMPNMDGITLIRKIRELNKDTLLMIITAYATIDTAKEAIKLGCYDYITKPFEAEEVSFIVKRALEGRRLAIEKQKLQEHLARAKKLSSLGEMAAGMAHEVNTVLTSIKLFLEMLLTKNIDDGGDIDNFSVILAEIERAENLTERFLDFAKPQVTEFRKANINKIIEKSLEFLKYKLDKQEIEISCLFDKDLPGVLCDQAKMEEVFLNLFMNSIEAMPKGGRLNMKTMASNERVIIVISDTGCGISKSNLDKIFDPFFTTKLDGSGLGLSIVHRIIDEHKGVISITSGENKGTEVRIELPISDG